MNSGLGQRIKEVRGSTHQGDFGAQFGVNVNTIGRYESEASSPKADFLLALCRHYNISPTWLLLGQGPRDYDPDHIYIPEPEEGLSLAAPGAAPDDYDLVPLVDAHLSAGDGAFVLSEQTTAYYAFRLAWVRSVAASARTLVLLHVSGDSMQPTIKHGDTVMIDTARQAPVEGGIFALRVDHTIMVKRLFFNPGGRVVVASDNRDREPYEIAADELHILGQVIWHCRVLVNEPPPSTAEVQPARIRPAHPRPDPDQPKPTH